MTAGGAELESEVAGDRRLEGAAHQHGDAGQAIECGRQLRSCRLERDVVEGRDRPSGGFVAERPRPAAAGATSSGAATGAATSSGAGTGAATSSGAAPAPPPEVEGRGRTKSLEVHREEIIGGPVGMKLGAGDAARRLDDPAIRRFIESGGAPDAVGDRLEVGSRAQNPGLAVEDQLRNPATGVATTKRPAAIASLRALGKLSAVERRQASASARARHISAAKPCRATRSWRPQWAMS